MLSGSFCKVWTAKSQKIQFFYQIILSCQKKAVPLHRQIKKI